MGWSSYFFVAAALATVTPVSAQEPVDILPPAAAGQPAEPPAAGGAPMGGVPNPGVNVRDVDVAVKRLEQEVLLLTQRRDTLLKELQEALTKLGADHPAVVARQREIEATDREIQRDQEELSGRLKALENGNVAKSRVLLRPVAVELKNATVRQAAEVLSKATRVPIIITADAPDDLRLTIQARGVSFGAVLQAIAKQTNLKIAPSEKGIVLTSWPMVAINGQLQVFKGAWAPWASEWGALPGYQTSDGWDFPGEADPSRPVYATELLPTGTPGGAVSNETPRLSPTPAAPAADPLNGEIAPVAPSRGSGFPSPDPFRSARSLTSSAAMAITLASLGDRTFAVSEPGRGPEGQLGAWITIYRIEGTQLKKTAVGFHALRTSTPSRGNIPGMPGMNPMGIPGLPGGTTPATPVPERSSGAPMAPPEGAADPAAVAPTTATTVQPGKGMLTVPVTVRARPAKKATTPKRQ